MVEYEYKNLMANAGLYTSQNGSQPLFSTKAKLCPMCLGPMLPQYVYCYHCSQARDGLHKALLPDTISFLAYAGATDQSRFDFHQYKNCTQPGTPNPGFLRIQALVSDFIAHHAKCMTNYVRAPVQELAFVPSGKVDRYGTTSPISQLIGQDNHDNIIQRNKPRTETRDKGIDPSRYTVTKEVSDRHVLLFEDTWVTGTNSLSSAAALKHAGAEHVSLVVFGRYLAPAKYDIHRQWLLENQLRSYDVAFCPVTKSYQCPPHFRF